MGGRVHSLRPSIGDATLRAQDLSLVASKVVDEMLVDITRVPDAPIECSESRQHRVTPGLDDPIHRVRLQGTRGCHMPAISSTASDAGVASISRWK